MSPSSGLATTPLARARARSTCSSGSTLLLARRRDGSAVQRRSRPLPLPLFFSDLIFLSFLLGSIRFRVGDGVRIEIRVWLGLGFRSLFFFPEFDSRVRVWLHVPRPFLFCVLHAIRVRVPLGLGLTRFIFCSPDLDLKVLENLSLIPLLIYSNHMVIDLAGYIL